MEKYPECTAVPDNIPVEQVDHKDGLEVTRKVEPDQSINYSLSKNQMKKRMKDAEWRQKRTVKRLKEREKRKLKKKVPAVECRTEDGKASIKKRRMTDLNASNVRVAIDCSYDHLMNDLEIKKLCKQVQRCYAENRNIHNRPLQFYICGLAGRFEEISRHVITGFASWDVHWKTSGPLVTFNKDEIVYLSSESPNILTELRSDEVYIIGGLVDHNHHKGHCYSLAEGCGLKHAQLPIGDYIKLRDRKVLTVNHVFEILLAFIQTKDWKKAFLKILPQRKLATDENPTAGDGFKGESSGHHPEILDEIIATTECQSDTVDILDTADKR